MILKNLRSVKEVDFMGNEVSLNKYYKVKLSEIGSVMRIDGLEIKDYARKDWRNIQDGEEIDNLVAASKREYLERCKSENYTKKGIVAMIDTQKRNVETMYDNYKVEMDNDMLQFMKWAGEFQDQRKKG